MRIFFGGDILANALMDTPYTFMDKIHSDKMAKKETEPNVMEREDAVDYLERKNKIEGEVKYSKEEEKQIVEVMKKGKIYGDPIVELE
jgi:hypothetical protein